MKVRKNRALEKRRKAQIREWLEERRRVLSEQLNATLSVIRTEALEARDVPTSGELASIDLGDDLDLSLAALRADMLSKVEIALRRLDTGAYGKCAECDAPITLSRLRALPFATRCLTCQTKNEASFEPRPRTESKGYQDSWRDTY